jgi:hypothetical protein
MRSDKTTDFDAYNIIIHGAISGEDSQTATTQQASRLFPIILWHHQERFGASIERTPA